MRYLLAAALLAASVALVFSGCTFCLRCESVDVVKAPSPEEQARILREARTVEKIP